MGTDMHACIEMRVRDLPDSPSSHPKELWSFYQKMHCKDYDLADALANGRSKLLEGPSLLMALFAPRGIPSDASEKSFKSTHFPIYEDDEVPPGLHMCVNRRGQIKPGDTVVRRDDRDYLRDDGCHNHSHLSHEEILLALEHFGLPLDETDLDFQAAFAAMTVLEAHMDTRLVFWFT